MTFLARTRRRLQKMSPYRSFSLLFVPLLLVEPLKLVAVFIAGKGHWLTGTGMLIGAYAVSLLFVERLFRMIKPKLMTLGWFARLWTWFTAFRAKVIPALFSIRRPIRVGTVSRFEQVPMCDECEKLDKKIEHYETILVSIGDRATVERLTAMIADLQAQKVVLHPEQKQ